MARWPTGSFHPLSSPPARFFTPFFHEMHFHSVFIFSVSLTTSPLPLSAKSLSIEKQILSYVFFFFFSVSLCIYTMHWQRSRAFLPAGFFVYFLCCYLYSHSAEKEPLTLTQIENMPSSYFCVSCTWMPVPCVIVALLYFSNRISCVCIYAVEFCHTGWC